LGKPADIRGEYQLRGSEACVGYLARSFDLINVRDLELIAQARRCCELLIVGVYADDTVLALTGRPPLVPLSERLALVSHVRGVDQAVVHDPEASTAESGVVVFVERGSGSADQPAAVSLEVTRHTESSALRQALAPTRTAVA
jgi:Cytidylyltransferase-like